MEMVKCYLNREKQWVKETLPPSTGGEIDERWTQNRAFFTFFHHTHQGSRKYLPDVAE
jgi:hypothetical protein